MTLSTPAWSGTLEPARYVQHTITACLTDGDGGVGVSGSTEHRQGERLASVHLHAKLPQPALQRGGAGDDTLLHGLGRGPDALVAAGARNPVEAVAVSRVEAGAD